MTHRQRENTPAAILVMAAFLVSGFTSLVLEVAWSKALALMLGSTLHAVSTVVAVYLGGLALGAYVAGRSVHRVARPLALYGLLEMGIGLYALASLSLLAALDPIIGSAYSRLGAQSAAYLWVRVGLSAALLLPPTTLMGATLPSLVAWATRAGESFGKSLGRLYGLNTLGAVLGAAIAGFALVPGLGLAGTTRAVGALALLVGGGMAYLGMRSRATSPDVETSAAPAAQEAPARVARKTRSERRALAALLFGASGAIALVLEITWTRVFALVYGSSVYSFAVVLASYLLAIALGSLLWGGRLADSKRPWLAFAILQAAVCAGVVVGLWFLPGLPGVFLSTLVLSHTHLPLLYLSQTGLASALTVLPCLAFGALFPVGARLLSTGGISGARATGFSYAVNTAGTLTGTLLAGFVLLPMLGVRTTLVASTLASLGLAAVAWWTSSRRESGQNPRPARSRTRAQVPLPSRPLAVAVAVALVVATLASPAWNKSLFTLGVYRASLAVGVGSPAAAHAAMERRLEEEHLLFYQEGLQAVVSVHSVVAEQTKLLSLRVNGKPDASTGTDIATQVLLGHLPMMWAPRGARVCVIGQGSGVTTRAALQHDPERVTVIEIEPAVIRASRYFDEVSDTVLADSRVELILEDGRQHLQHSGRRYDVIISEPSNPWIAGVNNLFTVDFYRRVQRALTPEGVFGQWVQLYELSPTAQNSLLSSLAVVFPRAEAFLVQSDLLIVAPPEGRRLSSDQLLLEGHEDPVASYLARFGLQANGALASRHLGSVAYLVKQFPAAPLNTDDRPFVEYRAPFDLYRLPGGRDPRSLVEPDPLLALERWVADSSLVPVAEAVGLELARRGDGERAKLLASELRQRAGPGKPGETAIVQLAEQSESVRRTQEWLALANSALNGGDPEAADRWLRKVFELQPDSPTGHLIAARADMRRERLDGARKHLAVTLKWGMHAERASAYNNLGIIEMRLGRKAEGRADFEAARRTHPGEPNSYVHLARWLVQAGLPDSARAVLREGLTRAYPPDALERALAAVAAGQSF